MADAAGFDVLVQLPRGTPNGAARHAELVTGDVPIAVTRSGPSVWAVEVSGTRGSFHLLFAVRITDAFDRTHEGETFVTVDGIDTHHSWSAPARSWSARRASTRASGAREWRYWP
ncbi:MAG: hypothetical protein ABS81_21580 [Pseudonocardia sp. SCN 72-86]|nr:MAG: hypothetical protein ABS81_21580 [Pseudonocardia sp. SCN 72-86]